MKPPRCAVCGKDFRNATEDGGLIYFKRRPEDEKWYKKAEKPGFIGHPPNAFWFCGEHYPDAKLIADDFATDALRKLKSPEK